MTRRPPKKNRKYKAHHTLQLALQSPVIKNNGIHLKKGQKKLGNKSYPKYFQDHHYPKKFLHFVQAKVPIKPRTPVHHAFPKSLWFDIRSKFPKIGAQQILTIRWNYPNPH